MIKKILITLVAIQISCFAMDKDSFESTVRNILKIYEGEITSKYKSIELDIDWASTTLNASVTHKDGKAMFSFHGEFVRKYKLTSDGFAVTVCHEIGHLIGGAPKVYPTKKFSSEAQSDYFATNECLPKYFSTISNNQYSLNGIKKEVTNACKNTECLRALAAIHNEKVIYKDETSLANTDKTLTRVTNFNDYPSPQCRVDTLKAGVLDMPRPKCWFSEDSDLNNGEYISKYTYDEAQIVGTAGKVTLTPNGCHIEIDDIDFHASSYLYPLSEDDIYIKGVFQVGKCTYSLGSPFSGSISDYESYLYLNLNPTDK